MKSNTQDELAKLKKRARTAALFHDTEEIVQIIERDIAEYEKSVTSNVDSEIVKATERLEYNVQVVEEIISEHDYISQLLNGSGKATAEQLDILLFPKTEKAKSNVLQVSGGAGTGKTLIMLVRIIHEVQQQDLTAEKKALFVCFNKSLKEYVRAILDRNFSNIADSITVINVDALVKRIMDKKHEQLGITYNISDLEPMIDEVAVKYQDENIAFLDSNNQQCVDWIKDEIDWIEGRKVIEFNNDYKKYQEFGRIGRGNQPFNPGKNSKARSAILEILEMYNQQNETNKKYTYAQAVNELLVDNIGDKLESWEQSEQFETPKYNIIAIDEVQDISVASILLLLTFRRPGAKVIIAGDEGQKIYKRDFTWKQLDGENNSNSNGVIGHTVTLRQNHRNHYDIEQFALRIKGIDNNFSPFQSSAVELMRKSTEEVVNTVNELKDRQQTTCVIVDTKSSSELWGNIFKNAGIDSTKLFQYGEIFTPGIYVANIFQVKGLEFDNVIIPNTEMTFDDEEMCRNLYYVAFTRARNYLGVYFQNYPNAIISRYYSDLIENEQDLLSPVDLPF